MSRDDRYEPTHPRHRELMLPCCPHKAVEYTCDCCDTLTPRAELCATGRLERKPNPRYRKTACERCGGAHRGNEWAKCPAMDPRAVPSLRGGR